ncbi:hypothetical protein HanIR_Chr17g0896151 [Helianthus annuus]|nr:hypothetical protein HanIR_Chr17g0896151 [Helianthus annuus]
MLFLKMERSTKYVGKLLHIFTQLTSSCKMIRLKAWPPPVTEETEETLAKFF